MGNVPTDLPAELASLCFAYPAHFDSSHGLLAASGTTLTKKQRPKALVSTAWAQGCNCVGEETFVAQDCALIVFHIATGDADEEEEIDEDGAGWGNVSCH